MELTNFLCLDFVDNFDSLPKKFFALLRMTRRGIHDIATLRMLMYQLKTGFAWDISYSLLDSTSYLFSSLKIQFWFHIYLGAVWNFECHLWWEWAAQFCSVHQDK